MNFKQIFGKEFLVLKVHFGHGELGEEGEGKGGKEEGKGVWKMYSSIKNNRV